MLAVVDAGMCDAELQMVEGEGSEQHAQRIEAFFSDPANLQKIDMKFQEADTDGSGQLEPAECLPLMSYFCKSSVLIHFFVFFWPTRLRCVHHIRLKCLTVIGRCSTLLV